MLMSSVAPLSHLENESEFIARHIGISEADEKHMLSVIGEASRRTLIDSIVPASIARSQAMKLPAPVTEAGALAELKAMAQQNIILKSFIECVCFSLRRIVGKVRCLKFTILHFVNNCVS